MTNSKHTPGPWTRVAPHQIRGRVGSCVAREVLDPSDAALIAAAPDLLAEARILRCLASSPRFQTMTVAEALAELAKNGAAHDNGAAIAKAEGR